MKQLRLLSALFLLLTLNKSLRAQLSGAYAVPGTFTSIASAISSLNVGGVTGPVTINIATGYTETAIAGGYSLYTVVGSSSVNTITFRKSGTGTNPVIRSYSGTQQSNAGTQDGVWRFIGADYITVDGLTITEQNSASPASMEFGFGFFKAGTTNGCQHDTIRNCVITLTRNNNGYGYNTIAGGSRGIDMVPVLTANMTGSVAVNSADGTNSYNGFYGNLIQNCNVGISLRGATTASVTVAYDTGNDIGGALAATGNTIINFGGGGNQSMAIGIYARGQQSLNLANNYINNNTGTGVNHQTELSGIYNDIATDVNVAISNNTISLKSATACPNVYVIENLAGSGTANNTVSITNNLVIGCATSTSASGAGFYGIHNDADCGNVVLANNTFTNNVNLSAAGLVSLINNSGQVRSSITLTGNVLSYSFTTSGSYAYDGFFNAIVNSNGTVAPGPDVNISSNSFSNFSTVSGGAAEHKFIYVKGLNSSLALRGNTWANNKLSSAWSVSLMENISDSRDFLNVLDNSVSSFTVSSTSGNTVTTGFKGYLGNNNTYTNCAMTYSGNVFSNLSVGGGGAFAALYCADGSGQPCGRKMIHNNIVQNIDCPTTYNFYGIYADRLGSGNSGLPSEVHSNTITGITSKGLIYAIGTGTTSSPGNNVNIYANAIASVVCTNTNGGAATGIGVYGVSAGISIYRNRIVNVVNAGVTWARGIESVYTANVDIYNNIIGRISAPVSTTPDAVAGIYVDAGLNHRIYFNTVYLDSIAASSSCIKTYTNSDIDLRNNILVNLAATSATGSATIIRRETGSLSTYNLASGNNLLYAGATATNRSIADLSTVTYSTLALAKQALGGREMSSVTESAPFTSTLNSASGYLSVNTASATQVESGAQPVAWITTDFYGNARNASTPDIGAVEGNYTPSAVDLAGPGLGNYGFVNSACNLSGRTFTAMISDISGVATGSLSPTLYYKINSGTYTAIPGILSSGSATLGLWSFNLNYTVPVGAVISYYLLAQDVAATPNLACAPPSYFVAANVNSVTTAPTPGTYTASMELNGTYTVGASGTFTSLTGAADAYNKACITGPVTFVLTNTLYAAPAETFPIVFKNNPDASATNSLLIVPAGGTGVTIQSSSLAATMAAIKFLDARYITLDGLNSSGSSMTIYCANMSSVTAGVWLASSAYFYTTGAGNKYIGLQNLVLSSEYYAKQIGVLACMDLQTNTLTIYPAADNDFISIKSNTFLAMANGIQAMGASTNIICGNNNWDISNNWFGNPVSSYSLNIAGNCINVQRGLYFSITSNTFCNVGIANNTQHYAAGIVLNDGMSNSVVSDNLLRSIKGHAGGCGISIYTGMDHSNLLVQNNMIVDVGYLSSGFSSQNLYGVQVSFSGGIKFYHNTVAMTMSNSLGSIYTTSSSCFSWDYGASGLDLRNNLFYNDVFNGSNSSSRAYIFYSTSGINPFTAIDYNNYYVAGTQGVLAYNGSGAINTMTALANNFGQNTGSINKKPAFTSTVDAHLDASSLTNYNTLNAGTPLGIFTDIDNQARSTATPVIGADEFGSTATCTTAAAGTISPSSSNACASESLALVSTGVNIGNGSSYQWQVSNSVVGTFTNVSLGSGATTQSFNTTGLWPAGTYYFKLVAGCASSTVASNVATVTLASPPSFTLSSSHVSVCAGTSATLSVAGGSFVNWSSGPNTPSIVVTPTTSGYYSVYGGNYPCPYITSTSIPLYYSPNPTVSISSAASSICSGRQATLTASGASSYSWSPNAGTGATVNPTPSVTTVYTVTGSYLSGCSGTATRNISVNASPTVSISGPAGICSGQNATLVASGASSYSWDTGSASATLVTTPTNNVTYTVTGTGGNGCATSVSQAVNVIVLQTPTITAPSTICTGDAALISVSGGTPYAWSTGANTPSIAPTPTTTTSYSVVTGAGSCTNSANVTVSVNPIPVLSITGNSVVCAGQPVSLTAGGANNYTWSTGSNLSLLADAPLSNTVYVVSGTSSLGCTGSASFAVMVNALPVIGISPSAPSVCVGGPATLTASGAASYTWSGGGSGNAITVTPASATAYTVSGTNAAGCVASATVAVATKSLPAISISPASTTVCAQNTLNLSASGAGTYTWSNGGGNGSAATYTASASVLYTVSGTDAANGCVNTQTAAVVTNSLPVIVVFGSSTLCAGQTTTLMATGASSYLWNTTASTPFIVVSPVATTNYLVIGTGANGCSSSTGFGITTYSLPVIAVSASPGTVCAGSPATLTASGAGTYTWSGGGNASAMVVTPTLSTSYSVSGSNAAGCVASQSIAVTTNSLPVIAINPGSAGVCVNSPVSFTASGAGTYTWSNAGGNIASVSYTPSINMVYTVTGNDANNNCVSSKTVAVTTNSLPLVSIAGATAVCAGQSATLNATGAASYSWSTGSTSNPLVVSPSINTSYVVSGTNALGCSASASFAVVSNSLPVLSVLQSATVVCSSSPVSFTASGANTYTWSTSANTNTLTVSPVANAIYTVNGTNAAGCVSSRTAAIATNSLPLISITPASATVCVNSPVSFAASGAGTYTWSNAGGNAAIVSYTPSANMVYTVTGNDAANNCVSSKTVGVITNSLPLVSIASATAVCAGQSATLNATGAASYSWSTGSTSNPLIVSPSLNTSYSVTGTNALGCSASASFAVVSNSLPVIGILQSATVVCSSSPVTFTASGANTYTWSTSANTNTLTVSPAANAIYTVNGTNAAGCVSSRTAAIATSSLPLITVNPASATVCVNSPISFAASGAGTYTWSNAGGNAASVSYTPSITMVYTVTGNDAANNCVSSKTVAVSTNSLPLVSVSGPSAVCLNQSVTLNASGASSYTWSSGPVASTIAVSPSSNTAYTVNATDANGCAGSAVKSLTVNPLPVMSISGNSAVCSGNAATLTASGALSYSWSTSAAIASVVVSPTAASAYSVVGTSSDNCQAAAFFTVNVNASPTLSISGPTLICSGSTVVLNASGASSYTWNGTITAASLAVSPLVVSFYSVTGTSSNGCQGTAAQSVSVVTTPTVSISGNAALCAGNSVTLSAGGANSYSWSAAAGGASTAVIVVSPAVSTVYAVTGFVNALCQNTAQVTVTVNALPTVSAVASSTALCQGQALTLTGSGAASYTWNNGVSNGSPFTPTATAAYTVTGSDANGCQGTAAVSVTVNLLPVLSVSSSASMVCEGEEVTLTASGANSYTWTNGGSTAILSFTPTIAGNSISVTGSGLNGCESTTVFAQGVDACTGIKGAMDSGQLAITIYPNPNNGAFYVSALTLNKELDIEVYDYTGRLVLAERLSSLNNKIDLGEAANGMYVVRIVEDGVVVKVERLMKQ